MKRYVLILVGSAGLIFGAYSMFFWGQAIRESGLLFSADQTAGREDAENQFPYFVEAVDRLGENIFAPSKEKTEIEDPADLANRITSGMYKKFTLGALSSLIGFVLLAVSFLRKKSLSEPAGGGNG